MASPLPTPLRLNPEAQQKVIGIGLDLLSDTALLWLVTLGAGAVWTIAVIRPEVWRIVAATLYSLVVLWPTLWYRRKGSV